MKKVHWTFTLILLLGIPLIAMATTHEPAHQSSGHEAEMAVTEEHLETAEPAAEEHQAVEEETVEEEHAPASHAEEVAGAGSTHDAHGTVEHGAGVHGTETAHEEHAEHGEHEEHHSITLPRTVNFVVLMGLLGYLLYAPIKGVFENRTKDIEAEVYGAETKLKENQKKHQEVKEKMATLSEHVQAIKIQEEEKAGKAKEELLHKANQKADSISEDATQRIGWEIHQARENLQRFAAEMACEIAMKSMKDKIKAEYQNKLVEQITFLEESK